MGRSCFIGALLLLALLLLSKSSRGHGRMLMETKEVEDSSVEVEETEGKPRVLMVQVMDYQLDPGPNTNPRTGFVFPPTPHG